MILFIALAASVTLGGWLLLRPHRVPEPAGPDDPPPIADEADDVAMTESDDRDGAVPAFVEDDTDWDDVLPRLRARRPAPPPSPPRRPEPADPEPFDMAALAARLAAEDAVAAAKAPARIEGFDAERDDLEIPVPADAVGAVTTRADADGLSVLVDGEAVALLAGCAALDSDRIRVVAA